MNLSHNTTLYDPCRRERTRGRLGRNLMCRLVCLVAWPLSNAAARAGVTLTIRLFFFLASLLLCLPKTDYRDKGRGYDRRLESRGCERLPWDVYWENLATSSKKSIHCGPFIYGTPLHDLNNGHFRLPSRHVQGGRCRGVQLYGSQSTIYNLIRKLENNSLSLCTVVACNGR